MSKYYIDILGNVVNKETGVEVNNKDFLDEIVRLPNKSNKVNNETNKFSELDRGGGFINTENLFSNSSGDNKKPETNRVINLSNRLRNDSFGFDSDPDREVTFYNSYNSIFDLDLQNFNTQNNSSVQIFAEDLDFYGFPLILKNTEELLLDELPVRLFTLIDMIIASAVPITLITTMQFLLQQNESTGGTIPVLFGEDITKKQNSDIILYDLGSYIGYKKYEDFNLAYDILKKTLQSFEKLMNYPRFPLPLVLSTEKGSVLDKIKNIAQNALFLLENIAKNVIYFVQGYIFYLNPGLKTNFTLEFKDLNFVSLFDFITSFITTDSSRHSYNLLIRKVLRNNYFLNKIIEGKARKQENVGLNLNSTFAFLSSFFFRFVGERVAVGEKLIKSDTMENKNKNNLFFQYRDKSTEDKKPNLSLLKIISDKGKEEINYEKEYNLFIPSLQDSKNHRLSYEKVKEIEQIIDKDYMPFTLQDLRTNEIFKFHAFIDSISDSYSANYNEIGGYGRAEKIKTYINTTRSINVSFKIAAMSPDDHDHMWYLINKLISMLYPQWSKGVPAREYLTNEIKTTQDLKENETSKYTLPFTQLPSNSPMIRLRIGDMIASNYSTYSASKLFGFERKININELSFERNKIEGHIAETNIYLNRQKELASKKSLDAINNAERLKKVSSNDRDNIIDGELEKNLKSIQEDLIKKTDEANKRRNEYITKRDEINKKIIEQNKRSIPIRDFINEKFMKSEVIEGGLTKINNPIIKSFESNLGKGLAGFITSFGIEWEQGSFWEIKEGSRAPKIVTITLGFSPSHDIPLGLDHRGNLRSVAYPVGSSSSITRGFYMREKYLNYDEEEFRKG